VNKSGVNLSCFRILYLKPLCGLKTVSDLVPHTLCYAKYCVCDADLVATRSSILFPGIAAHDDDVV